ncbi:DUF1569 domain-containing protein [Winogradskyella sp.]|uniref:DUF1569 domain-containing protein n=1 Tax=Winogradskyella sp. TaxID=1883156 RepID=UPI0025F16979|nr:DUF1569 domain-containing protein [Winogradskyella sp.]MBT8245617.1 DUF1569 domain-containing protein [Winogradskyella sp.]
MSSTIKLANYIKILESHIPKHELTNPKVSKATIGWQIGHSLKVINNVSKAMQSSEPNEYKKNFSFLGKVFFTLGTFPRGKAKAPKHVKPPEVILKESLISQIEEAKVNVKTIKDLNANAFFKHPLFGHVNKKRVHRFLEIHTNHHLKIINDILNK